MGVHFTRMHRGFAEARVITSGRIGGSPPNIQTSSQRRQLETRKITELLSDSFQTYCNRKFYNYRLVSV